jgi:hypothetical protein
VVGDGLLPRLAVPELVAEASHSDVRAGGWIGWNSRSQSGELDALALPRARRLSAFSQGREAALRRRTAQTVDERTLRIQQRVEWPLAIATLLVVPAIIFQESGTVGLWSIGLRGRTR